MEDLRREVVWDSVAMGLPAAARKWGVDQSQVSRWHVRFDIPVNNPSRQPADHGTHRRYHQGCRCAECREANTDLSRQQRAERRRRLAAGEQPPGGHGSASTYLNWGCRCDDCTKAHSQKCRDGDARRRAAAPVVPAS